MIKDNKLYKNASYYGVLKHNEIVRIDQWLHYKALTSQIKKKVDIHYF